jgi:beta-N-acetylhexosaminidase
VSSPLLLMTDQEGGIVRRLPGEPVLSEKQIGDSADPVAGASAAGTGAGENLAGVGMNTNLAPVLDVFRQAGNFDDEFGRSYSMDPNVCAECGAAMIAAQQKLNIAATAKHFPGLGAATVDQNTDLGPVTLDVPLADLRSIDERPFWSAIAAGVRMVMTSWAVYPALDPKLPSGLSPTIVEGELRRRLRFRGVTITDALEAGAIASFGTPAQCGVLAAQAGMDVLLCSARDVSEGQDTVAAIADALQHHALNPGHFEIALRRVLALRNSLA